VKTDCSILYQSLRIGRFNRLSALVSGRFFHRPAIFYSLPLIVRHVTHTNTQLVTTDGHVVVV